MKGFIAVAAMAQNRVIGNEGRIPWHLPEDFKWFKRLTLGHHILMGRKTFDSLNRKPLPGRENIVVSRAGEVFPDGVRVLSSLDEVEPTQFEGQVFVIGGGQIYAQLLPRCSDLYLTLVRREVEGDAFFPEFESGFDFQRVVFETPEFEVRHYRSKDPRFSSYAVE